MVSHAQEMSFSSSAWKESAETPNKTSGHRKCTPCGCASCFESKECATKVLLEPDKERKFEQTSASESDPSAALEASVQARGSGEVPGNPGQTGPTQPQQVVLEPTIAFEVVKQQSQQIADLVELMKSMTPGS